MNEKGILYICDPDKNTLCKKSECQTNCRHTTHIAFVRGGRAFRRYQLAYIRALKSLTQEQLGNSIGVSGKTVYNWESGRTVPHKKNLMKLCYILGVTNSDHMFTTDDRVMRADRYKLRNLRQTLDICKVL